MGLVGEGLNIWTSFVAFNPHLLKGLYSNPESQSQIKGGERDHFVQVLVDQGLLGDNSDVRDAFKEALLFVCLNVRDSSLPEPPESFFLRVLLEKLEFMTTVDPCNTLQYFALFSDLMRDHFEKVASTDSEFF